MRKYKGSRRNSCANLRQPYSGLMTQTRPTLRAVAERAGTSIPTVSKVLRGGTDVSASMRQRVLTAAAEVGYQRTSKGASSSRARALPPLVDLVMSAVDNSWATRALGGVEAAATEVGMSVIITIAKNDGEWVARLMRRSSEGAVIVGVGPTSTQLAALQAAAIPVVLVDPVRRPPDEIASVGSTNWEGGYSAGRHLVGLGHRRIAVIAGGPGYLYSSARVDGFRSALREAGVTVPDALAGDADWLRSRAYEIARPMLLLDERPTAIFACSESMAFGVYDAAESLGIRIPDDLSVIGFDDLPEARWATPPMSTIRQPTADMGAVALNLLADIMSAGPGRGSQGEVSRIELATQLVARESTAVAPVAT
ncbi:MAG: hypothetical protein JWP75_2346 [Frondihabitans sp.]|nr:hypothetical protein [Frondihabitans sp.]